MSKLIIGMVALEAASFAAEVKEVVGSSVKLVPRRPILFTRVPPLRAGSRHMGGTWDCSFGDFVGPGNRSLRHEAAAAGRTHGCNGQQLRSPRKRLTMRLEVVSTTEACQPYTLG